MSKEFALQRSRALASCEGHIQRFLFSVAKRIVVASQKYRRDRKLLNEKGFLSQATSIASRETDNIENTISSYALASAKQLNIDSDDGIKSFLSSSIYGKTSRERTSAYLKNFAEDVVRMVKAATLMGYSDSQMLSAVRTGYKNPYLTSVISKARTEDINIATPSYGRGIFHAAYQNIIRNAKHMVSIAWGMAEQQYGMENGAIGFRSYRGSSYPCPYCDDETTYLHHFGDPYPPYHLSCCCYVKFVYENEEE